MTTRRWSPSSRQAPERHLSCPPRPWPWEKDVYEGVKAGVLHGSKHPTNLPCRLRFLRTRFDVEQMKQRINTCSTQLHPNNTLNAAEVCAIHRLATEGSHSLDRIVTSQLRNSAHAHEWGSPNEAPMKNEFRQQFEVVGALQQGEKAGREQLIPRLDLLTRALFLEAALVETTAVLDLVAGSGSRPAAPSVHRAFAALVREGRIALASDLEEGAGAQPIAFDLLHPAPFAREVSAGDLLTAYCASGIGKSEQTAAVAAFRDLLRLPTRSARSTVLVAARAINCRHFHALPERYARDAASRPALSEKTRRNHVSSLRRVLSFGLREDLFPLFFPLINQRRPWSDFVDRAFPLSASGVTPSRQIATRSGLISLFRIAFEEFGHADAATITPELIRRCWTSLSTPSRRRTRSLVGNLVTGLSHPGAETKEPVLTVIRDTLASLRKRPALPRLQHATDHGVKATSTVGCIAVLDSQGLPADWAEFLRWYEEYSSLDWRALVERAHEFPIRPPVRQLSSSSYRRRLDAICVYLAFARDLLSSEYRLLTPVEVFGRHFPALTMAIVKAWEEFARTASGVSHRSSAGLRAVVLSGGMLARALHDSATATSTQ